jgi:serine/threonine protein kinase
MHPDLTQSDEMRERFRQEARVAAQIDSEFIVDVFDAGVDDKTRMPFLVMEMLRGEPISKAIRKAGRLAPQVALTYLHQTALALDKTHRARIVHRDLKPDNLFLCEREDGPPRVKVLDFGIAKIVAENSAAVNATRAVGTPLFMAPEQFTDGVVSPATDRYAVAMIAYLLLVGRSYWAEEAREVENVFALADHIVQGPQEPASVRAARRGVELPAGFDAWFARAAAKSPDDRFPSAGASVTALAEVFGVQPSSLGGTAVLPVALPGDEARWSLSDAQPLGSSTPKEPVRPSLSEDVPIGDSTTGAPGRTLLASEMTAGVPWTRKRPALVLGGGALAVALVAAIGYFALSSGEGDGQAGTQPSSSASATATPTGDLSASAEPVRSADPAPTVSVSPAAPVTATQTASASSSAPAIVPSSTAAAATQRPVTPATKGTGPQPTGTATSTKGRWIRD